LQRHSLSEAVAAWGEARMARRRVVERLRDKAVAEATARGLAHLCPLLRCVLGSPFRPLPPLDLTWLAWHGGAVKRLAEAAYEERELPSGHLDAGRLAVLADMLEESGCADAELLGHLRGPGPHVRGCWVVDLLLGKG
jgi:hypothetical protein